MSHADRIDLLRLHTIVQSHKCIYHCCKYLFGTQIHVQIPLLASCDVVSTREGVDGSTDVHRGASADQRIHRLQISCIDEEKVEVGIGNRIEVCVPRLYSSEAGQEDKPKEEEEGVEEGKKEREEGGEEEEEGENRAQGTKAAVDNDASAWTLTDLEVVDTTSTRQCVVEVSDADLQQLQQVETACSVVFAVLYYKATYPNR